MPHGRRCRKLYLAKNHAQGRLDCPDAFSQVVPAEDVGPEASPEGVLFQKRSRKPMADAEAANVVTVCGRTLHDPTRRQWRPWRATPALIADARRPRQLSQSQLQLCPGWVVWGSKLKSYVLVTILENLGRDMKHLTTWRQNFRGYAWAKCVLNFPFSRPKSRRCRRRVRLQQKSTM